MIRLTIDGLKAALPDVEELRPVLDHLLAESEADPARAWAGSGILGTAGDRIVDTAGLLEQVRALADREHEHARRIYELTARAVEHLAGSRPTEAASALLEAAALEEAREHPARAEAYADSAYRIAREGTDPGLTSLALRRRARHRRFTGRYSESEHDYEEAVLIADAAGDVRGAAEAVIGAGNVLEDQGHWDRAAERYRSALGLLESLDEPTSEVWHAWLNLHVCLRWTGSLDESAAALERASQIATTVGDAAATPFIENAHGQLQMALGDFEAAERHLRRAIDTCTGARAEITIRLNLAETLLAQGRSLDSAEEARRAERRAIVARRPQKLPEVYRLLGRIAAGEDTQDAFVLFERALEIIDDRALPTLERAQTLQAYADVEARIGDAQAADELHAEADRLYRGLGIEHRRRQWADRFDDGAEAAIHRDRES